MIAFFSACLFGHGDAIKDFARNARDANAKTFTRSDHPRWIDALTYATTIEADRC
jgi:hypothetical protein